MLSSQNVSQFNFILTKRSPSQISNVTIDAFQSINDTNLYKDVWVCDETFFRYIKGSFPTIQGLDIDRRYFNLVLSRDIRMNLTILLHQIN